MDTRLRTTLTLLVLLAVVGGAAAWGWSRLTNPVSEETSGPCVDTELEQGDRVRTPQVLVTVLNAGTRSGLASRTMSDLTDAGFVEADLRNAPGDAEVPRAQIWTDQPRSPAVRLVRSYLGDVTVVRRDPVTEGVDVVVGNGFEEVTDGRRGVRVREATTLCLVEQ